MSAVTLRGVIQAIQNQIPALGRDPFTIDQRVAEAARNQFSQNYNRNWLYSKCSSLVGLVSFAGFGLAAYQLFISPIAAIAFASISFALSQLWVNTRNREGYALQNALNARDEDEIIRLLSLGANIYQKVWPYGGAAANLFPILKGGPRTVMQTFAEAGHAKVVAYLAMLEPDVLKRAQMATDTLPYAVNRSTARLLLDLGANIHGAKDVLSFCCLRRDLEMVRFFAEAGARLDSGIPDYQRWQADFERREREFGGNWYPGNNEGVSLTLHPDFKTPLERLLAPDFGPNGRIESPFANNPALILEAMHV
ncbi:MAG TPA: hypothetical protein VHK67_03230, partial [Rhabdochlamydiaceae bacterium]|nr:hypothetical protein [Rhabdochlamydiaceae bacterium]